jgi:hypothetical protein
VKGHFGQCCCLRRHLTNWRGTSAHQKRCSLWLGLLLTSAGRCRGCDRSGFGCRPQKCWRLRCLIHRCRMHPRSLHRRRWCARAMRGQRHALHRCWRARLRRPQSMQAWRSENNRPVFSQAALYQPCQWVRTHDPKNPVALERIRCGCSGLHFVLPTKPQQPQAIGNHQQAGTHVGKHRHPHGGIAKNRPHKENSLDAQGQRDVLPQHGIGAF